MPELRRQLHGLGYASLPIRVSASEVGAPHRRARSFLVAHADGHKLREKCGRRESRESPPVSENNGALRNAPDAYGSRRPEQSQRDSGPEAGGQGTPGHHPLGLDLAATHADGPGLEVPQGQRGYVAKELAPAPGDPWGPPPPPVRGVDDGIPPRLDRPHIEAYGRAVVPQVAYAVGVLAAEWWGLSID